MIHYKKYGTMNSLVHDHFLHVQIDLEQSLGVIVPGARRIIPAYIFFRIAMRQITGYNEESDDLQRLT